jgi:lipopolysaccharide/colanic/teichoic acid biosynthesis glycosyltransferase
MTARVQSVSRLAGSNFVAQAMALISVTIGSLLVARVAGPTGVGVLALLRIMPWLTAVILTTGLPVASTYMLSARRAPRSTLHATIASVAAIGGLSGAVFWLAAAPALHLFFFQVLPLSLVLAAAPLVFTQLVTVTAKACCQGSDDLAGSNRIIVVEEAAFLPGYTLMLAVGSHGLASVVFGLLISGVVANLYGIGRLVRQGFASEWGNPSRTVARELLSYGARGQFGNLLWLMNLRLDFLILGALAGPAVLGVYAVASKAAELMRLPATALNYVLYPRYAAQPPDAAAQHARRTLPRAGLLTTAIAPLVAVCSATLLPAFYGSAFRSAVAPAVILVLGLAPEGAAAVSSALLLGTGRPGLNSLGMAAGVCMTAILDAVLIPGHGAIGAAVASTAAYLTASGVLVLLCLRRPVSMAGVGETRLDSHLRRTVDLIVAGIAVTVLAPVILVLAALVRLTSSGPAFYRQLRVGKEGKPFVIVKLRTMRPGADIEGPLVTADHDPRVTRFGRFLRKTHLDELPQLTNLLRGDMTLIGPRPEVPEYVRHYSPGELEVLRVRPGLTGPGQVTCAEFALELDHTGNPEQHYLREQMHPKLAVELAYLAQRGLCRDLFLLMGTARLVFSGSRPSRRASAPRQLWEGGEPSPPAKPPNDAAQQTNAAFVGRG